jgi:hypothetical protein
LKVIKISYNLRSVECFVVYTLDRKLPALAFIGAARQFGN